ncbi:MAG TPA: AraC family transcriptional regulator [Candidatus Enterocloster excrementigallinarum]|uniref:AraC family transcriptional regulator n=1 Tax=Candidatus Enterocloster excrementigallinarum TaxID=2838558 RepID=A0A9D2TDK0_9FIRM|nr:AraC family transcriptional regulator [Candidatus Enterocloster excrementigallinarum]
MESFELKEGKNATPLPFLSLDRFTAKDIPMPDDAKPYLYLVVNGILRLHTIYGILDYIPGQYSLSAIDSPLSGQFLTAASHQEFLALQVELSVEEVISVMLDLDEALTDKIFRSQLSQRVMSGFDSNITGIALNMLQAMEAKDTLTFMGNHLKREMIFDIINGTNGKSFLQSILNLQDAGEIYSINSWIKQNYRGNFTVEELAKQLNMSISSFHQKFKYAVGMGPLQCQKRLRLTEARRLMLDEGKKVADAAMEVGYESASQFTRDYRRMFGSSPKNDILQLGRQLKL